MSLSSAGSPGWSGKLRFSEWTGRDGERRSKIQVVGDAVQFLGSPKKAGDPDGGVSEEADGRRRLPPQGKLTAATGGRPRRAAVRVAGHPLH